MCRLYRWKGRRHCRGGRGREGLVGTGVIALPTAAMLARNSLHMRAQGVYCDLQFHGLYAGDEVKALYRFHHRRVIVGLFIRTLWPKNPPQFFYQHFFFLLLFPSRKKAKGFSLDLAKSRNRFPRDEISILMVSDNNRKF